MLPGVVESHWMTTAPRAPYPPLEEDLDADVVVVGAGIAGICTAWELACAGRSVVLLEADRVAAGVTGFTTAKLTAQHTFIYDDVARKFGADAGRLYAVSQQAAVERVALLSAELGIDCELERCPAYTYVQQPENVQQVRVEVAAALRAGLKASFVTEAPLPFPIAAAIRVSGQAQFHPRKYLLGLLDDFTRKGGRVFERSWVVDLVEGDPCQVVTEAGVTVAGTDVVVTTHYPVFDRAMLFSRLSVTREFVIAAEIADGDAPDGVFITPEQCTRSVRTAPWQPDKRLLIITGEHCTPRTGTAEDSYQRLLNWTSQHFPRAEVTHRWATQDTATLDGVPYIGPFHAGAEHTWVATGFGGWGMSSGVMAGGLLAKLIGGNPPHSLFTHQRSDKVCS